MVTRMCPSGGVSRGGNGDDTTPLARSLLELTDPVELARKLQATCKTVLCGVLERSSFTVRGLMAAPGESEASGVAGRP